MLRFLLSILIFWAIIWGILSFFNPLSQLVKTQLENEFQDRLSLALENSGVSVPADLFKDTSSTETGTQSSTWTSNTQNTSNSYITQDANGFGAWDNTGGNSRTNWWNTWAKRDNGWNSTHIEEKDWKELLTSWDINILTQEWSNRLHDSVSDLKNSAKGYFGTPYIAGYHRAALRASTQEGGLIFDPALILPGIPSGLPPYYFGNTRMYSSIGTLKVCMYLLDNCSYRYDI